MKTAKKHVKKARTPQASKTLEVLKIRARDLAQAVGLIELRVSQLPVVPSAARRRSDEETDKLAREFAPLLAQVSDITIEFLKQALRADALARQLDRFESLDEVGQGSFTREIVREARDWLSQAGSSLWCCAWTATGMHISLADLDKNISYDYVATPEEMGLPPDAKL